jgi:hypothetical protein
MANDTKTHDALVADWNANAKKHDEKNCDTSVGVSRIGRLAGRTGRDTDAVGITNEIHYRSDGGSEPMAKR